MSLTFDRDAAREVLHSYADEYIATDDEALDALAGCVRPVPPQTIDRGELSRENRRLHEVIQQQADRVAALLALDSRFDTIRALHRPFDFAARQWCRECSRPNAEFDGGDIRNWPCATVRALDGNAA